MVNVVIVKVLCSEIDSAEDDAIDDHTDTKVVENIQKEGVVTRCFHFS